MEGFSNGGRTKLSEGSERWLDLSSGWEELAMTQAVWRQHRSAKQGRELKALEVSKLLPNGLGKL